jgi:hypothetical protein
MRSNQQLQQELQQQQQQPCEVGDVRLFRLVPTKAVPIGKQLM